MRITKTGMVLFSILHALFAQASMKWDPILQAHARVHIGSRFDWRVMRAQMLVESSANPKAVSSSGAQGLFQLMPETDAEVDGVIDGTNPDRNIENATVIMARLWDQFSEIPDPRERLRAVLAAYTGGKAYVNRALCLARQSEGLPFGFSAWCRAGMPSGCWQHFSTWSRFLFDRRCVVNGRRPRAKRIVEYVKRIERLHERTSK